MVSFKDFILNEMSRNTRDEKKNQPILNGQGERATVPDKILFTFKGFDIYKFVNEYEIKYYVIKDEFNYGGLVLEKYTKSTPYKNPAIVSKVNLEPAARGKGIALELYKTALNEYSLIMDTGVSQHAQKIWEKLCNIVKVDVFDRYRSKILKSNVKIKAGDPNIWVDKEIKDANDEEYYMIKYITLVAHK